MITYHTSSERLYFSLSNDVNHHIIIYDPLKMCLKNSLFSILFFFNTDISVASHYEAWKF